MTTRAIVLTTIQEVAGEQSRSLRTLDDNTLLIESGLNSLCLAVIVAKLEDALGVDPFSTNVAVDFPRTIGDFVRNYERVLV